MDLRKKQLVSTATTAVLANVDRIIGTLASLFGLHADAPGVIADVSVMAGNLNFEMFRWGTIAVILSGIWLFPWWFALRRASEKTDSRVEEVAAMPHEAESTDDNLQQAKERIRELIALIPTPRTPSTHDIFAAILTSNQSRDVRDWEAETKAAMKGLVKASVYKEYLSQLRSKQPELAAKHFLVSLSIRLSKNDLR